jgi:hypothetical protein
MKWLKKGLRLPAIFLCGILLSRAFADKDIFFEIVTIVLIVMLSITYIFGSEE